MGGLENLKTARKYLSYTVILNKNSPRALWALQQCLVSLLSLKREEKDEALKSKLERRLQKIYSNSPISLSTYPF
jgi:predicted Fe-Mo cluster-binding NifX family protein